MKSEFQTVEPCSTPSLHSRVVARVVDMELGSLRRRTVVLAGLFAVGFAGSCAGVLIYAGVPGMVGLEANATELLGGLGGGTLGQLWLGVVVTAAVLAGE